VELDLEQAVKADKILDVRGWSCPWCILKAKSQLNLMKTGEVLEVLVTDPMTLADLPNVLGRSGHYLIQAIQQSEFSRLYVRRGHAEE
jgi:tRNA 2-thiouridine synthesizing protein A